MHCSLIGVGKMGEAILKGLLPSVKKGQITLTGYEISPERKREIEEKYRLPLAYTLEESITDAQVILIAVKPQQMKELLAQMGSKTSNRLLISIAAGIPSDFIQARVAPGTRIVRVMPNTPALIGEGALAYSLGPNTTEEDRETVRKLLTSLGTLVEVPEKLMDAVTALSGSGPAYVFLFLQALCDAGVKVGLPRDLAHTLALKTMTGSLKLIEELQEHPARMIEMVTSPGGTTIAALHTMERAGFKGIIMDSVEAAACRSQELAKG